MSETTHGSLEAVTFKLNEELFGPQWQVIMQEDGSLFIFPVGRRNGKVLIQPSSHTTIHVTTDKIVKRSA